MAMDDIYDVINWILTKLATLVPEAEVKTAREALNKAAAKASAPAPPAPAKKQETAHA